MPFLARIRSLRDLLLRKEQLEADLDNELKAFVEQIVERHVAHGMTHEAARRAALLEVGGLEAVKDDVRTARIGNGVETTIGQVTAVLALEAVIAGTTGSYGASGSDGVVPLG